MNAKERSIFEQVSGTLSVSGPVPNLPQPGTPAFEAMIRKGTEAARRRQVQRDEPVDPQTAEERRLADAFLTNNLERMRRIEQ